MSGCSHMRSSFSRWERRWTLLVGFIKTTMADHVFSVVKSGVIMVVSTTVNTISSSNLYKSKTRNAFVIFVWPDWDMSDLLKYVGGTAGAITLGAITASAAAWYMMSRVPPPRLDVPIDDQSQKVSGVSACRMSRYCIDGKLMVRGFDDIFTCIDMFKLGMERSNDGPALGWRDGNGPYQWLKFSEVLERAKHVGAGLLKVGLKPVNTTHVGIYSQNKLEYILTELGCYHYSMVVVPLYDTLGVEACTYIINQANLELVMCDKAERVHKLMEHRDQTPNLKYIITADGVLPEDVEKAKQFGVQIIKFADLEKMGRDNPSTPMPAQADDLSLICYTSGTTGTPKGAMISHGNIVANVTGNAMVLCYLKVEPGDAMISYLPLAHIYERICQYVMFVNGGKVGFYRGDVKLLMDDILELKPAVFPSVPRLLNRIYDKVMSAVNSSRIKKMLFDMAMRSKMKDVRRGIARGGSIWDKIVFAKIQKSLGGNIKFVVSGSAPLSPNVLDFLRCAVGAAVVSEGYGQTECAAVATLQLEGEGHTGHVGPPIPSCMIKLVDVPEMNYFASDNQGEVCIKGPIVFRGYLNQPDKTAEALDQEGWLHTGDIGQWTSCGALKIVDRKKNIFKLAQGEYIAPEKIENALTNSQTVAQVFVHGDSLKASLVAVAVPDPEVFNKWAKEEVGVTGTMEQLCANPAVKKAVLAELNKMGKSQGLSAYEQVRGLHLHPELFSIENGLLTPTFKTKRQAIVHHFAKEIEQMYKTLQ